MLELLKSRAFHAEVKRTLTAWAVLFIVGVWMVICQQWSDMRWLRRQQQNTSEVMSQQQAGNTTTLAAVAAPWPSYAMLEDQVLNHLPAMERTWISDKLVGTSVIICMVGGSIMAPGWRERLMLLRRIAWMVAVLYFIRSITISVTTVPPSVATCEIAVPQSMLEVILATPDILAGNIGQCTDKIFSGHTAILMISFLFWLRYARHWGFIAYSAVHTTLGILSVLLARYHYTVDVVIGALLTYFVHHIYYTSLDQAIRQQFHVETGQRKTSFVIDDYESNEYYSMVPTGRRTRQRLDDDAGDLGEAWHDHDSAVGVDFGDSHVQQQQAHQVPAVPSAPCGEGSAFVFRKRETSSTTSTTAISMSAPGSTWAEENSEADESGATAYQHGGVPTRGEASASPQHHGITVHDELDDGMGAMNIPHGQFVPMSSGRTCISGHSRLELLGINRPFGSVLPAAVSWMDGLDLRYPSACP